MLVEIRVFMECTRSKPRPLNLRERQAGIDDVTHQGETENQYRVITELNKVYSADFYRATSGYSGDFVLPSVTGHKCSNAFCQCHVTT